MNDKRRSFFSAVFAFFEKISRYSLQFLRFSVILYMYKNQFRKDVYMSVLLDKSSAQRVMRKYTRLMFIFTLISFTLYSALIVPLYSQLSSDVVYKDGILTTLLYLLYNSVDLAVMFVVFPVTLYSVYLRGVKASAKLFAVYPALVVYKYVLNTVASYISDGALPTVDRLFRADLLLIGGLVLFEMLQYALVCLFGCIIINRARRIFDVKQKAASVGGREYSFRDGIFPIKKFFDFKNPLQRSAFVTAVVFFVFRAYMNVIYQFTLLIYNSFNDGWFVLITDLLIDAALAAVCYLVCLMILQKMDMSQLKIASELKRTEDRGEGIDI